MSNEDVLIVEILHLNVIIFDSLSWITIGCVWEFNEVKNIRLVLL